MVLHTEAPEFASYFIAYKWGEAPLHIRENGITCSDAGEKYHKARRLCISTPCMS